ncbi:lytic transglycosylase domain-containing protein [Gemmatimonadota bacterium]
MNDIKLVAAEVAGALQHAWDRLSATQQIMMRGIGLFALLVFVGGAFGGWAPGAVESLDGSFYNGTAVVSKFWKLQGSQESAAGEQRLGSSRAEALAHYSSKYGVSDRLAALIYDVALQEGIDPDLGFRLVNIESGFSVTAVSRANAYGLTQLQVPTARFYESDITMERLFEPERNLRIGFRFLRDLLETYGDVSIALLAYNRGPSRVKDLIDAGRDPDNGYPSVLMEGYTGGSR